MSKKSNPTVIGAFVVGAIILLASAIALFGGAELLAKRQSFVAYFAEDTKGLRVGSNVMMNGVVIGQVAKIALIIEQSDWQSKTEVTIQIFPENYIAARDGKIIGSGPGADVSHDELINVAGLRATLAADNLLTGQLLMDVSFRPDTAPVMRGGDNPPHPEIPTIPSKIQELLAKLQTWVADLSEHFDAEEFASNLQSTVRGVNEIANSQDLRDTLAGINALTNRRETQDLTATLESAIQEVESAAAEAATLLQTANTKLDEDLQPILDKVNAAMAEAQDALAAAKVQLRGDSSQAYQITETLREIEGAARSLREFLDYLETHPEALLKGKE